MPLSTGSRLGPYEITGAIGAGGMGEVYRARDTKLGRDVAIKVLPEAFARDTDRMARFQREAKVLASLNHPNIASIYGLEDSGSTHALVMELVEGPTLADRIKAGPIPIEEELRIAKQICEALEYAHERGIVHRDLKPANVKVTADDAVKILDFGLAKALEGDAASADISTSPTISRAATQAGVLLGTAAYMSPEQAKAKPVDRRADIWAFGCVLYEMLTDKQSFTGETVTDTLAAVIRAEPDWSQLPAATPIRVRVLLQRCLQKDPKQRLRDIGDARISLDEVLSGTPEAALASAGQGATPRWRSALPWALLGATAIALGALAFVHFSERPAAPAQLLRYEVPLPEKTSFVANPGGVSIAISPDGRHLAFPAKGADGFAQVWVRDLDSLESRPLPGTEGAAYVFWSPDSHTLAFRTGDKLERMDTSGGAPQVICNAGGIIGGLWNQDGVIVFGSLAGVIKVSAAGGPPTVLVPVDTSRGEGFHAALSFLPDGRHFLYYRGLGSGPGTYLGSLDNGGGQASSKRLTPEQAVYVPDSGTGPGHVLFLQNGVLMAQTFDASRSELKGDPRPVAEGVTNFSASANGVLAYTRGNAGSQQLAWFNRQGKTLGTVGEPGVITDERLAISPDGSAVAVARTDTGGTDLWLYDLASGKRSRLTFDGKDNNFPAWSPDGSRVAFASTHEGFVNVYQKAVNGMGQEEALQKPSGGITVPLDWSPDGRYLIEGIVSGGRSNIAVLPLSPEQAASDRRPAPYFNDQLPFGSATLSPTGQWVAYNSDETGRDEIYVRTFPKPIGKWPVSVDGGLHPVWSRDGKELYFIAADGKLMAADVKSGPGGSFQSGVPRALFDPHIGSNRTGTFGVTKDGRFLIPVVAGQSGGQITVVANWTAALNK